MCIRIGVNLFNMNMYEIITFKIVAFGLKNKTRRPSKPRQLTVFFLPEVCIKVKYVKVKRKKNSC